MAVEKIFSSIKTTSAAGCRTWEAFMSYMAEKFGNEQHLVSGWILGNEVDSPYDWNYAGGKSLSAYMDDYARAFRIAYNATKSVSSHSKVYISLDYNWNQDVDGGGNSFFRVGDGAKDRHGIAVKDFPVMSQDRLFPRRVKEMDAEFLL